LSDLKEKNRIRMQEIEIQHQRELASQATNNARALAEQGINEKRKLDDLKTDNIRRIQAIASNNNDALAEIEKGLKAEYDTIKKWEGLKTDLVLAEMENRRDKVLAFIGKNPSTSGFTPNPNSSPFQQALQSSGYQVPTSAFFTPPVSPVLGTQTFSATNTQQNTFNVGAGASSDAIQRSIIASLLPQMENTFS